MTGGAVLIKNWPNIAIEINARGQTRLGRDRGLSIPRTTRDENRDQRSGEQSASAKADVKGDSGGSDHDAVQSGDRTMAVRQRWSVKRLGGSLSAIHERVADENR